jgi:amino acid permease
MLRKNSSFWPSKEELLLKHPSLEFINPHYDSELRKSSHITSIFTLVSNMCGGGVLTLPIAFSRAGIVPSFLLMVLSAVMTDFAMYILCSCSRRTGGTSYGQVTRSAFGVKAELAVTVLLLFFLCFVIVAYMVLVKDIWTPLLLYTSPSFKKFCTSFLHVPDPEDPSATLPSFVFLAFFIIVSLPLLLQRDLHALRHTCYVGFTSLLLLLVAIVRRSIQLNFDIEVGIFSTKVKWYSTDWNDIIYAFPIIALSFFSIYNVLTVHSALINPTRERVKQVLDGTISICFILFLVIGIAGYLYAYDETKDNILLNFPLSYKIILMGRLGYGFTLMFGLPLIFLPCRGALLAIPKLYHDAKSGIEVPIITPNIQATISRTSSLRFQKHGMNCSEEKPLTMSSVVQMNTLMQTINKGNLVPPIGYGALSTSSNLTGISSDGHLIVNGIDFDAERPSLMRNTVIAASNNGTSTTPIVKPIDYQSEVEKAKETEMIDKNSSTFEHVTSTLVILICCYFIAVAVPGVGIVWSICGSSMALIIGFFIPAACYLKIRSNKMMNPRSLGAWSLLVFSMLASVVCTSHVVVEIRKAPGD